MRNITFFLTFLLTTFCVTAQVLVMKVTVHPGTTSCRFSGAFWGWDPNGGPVGEDNGNDSFTFTLSPPPGADMEYLYTINGSGVYENLIDNALNSECTGRVDDGNFNTDYSSYANRIWKTTDALTWNEIYDDCSSASLSINNQDVINFKLYPNPTRNSWMVNSKHENITAVKVFDILGKQVMTLSPNSREAVIEGNKLNSGLYFAQIKTTSGASSLKLVKQ